MLKIRRLLGRLIFNMGIAIPGKTVFLIETAPCHGARKEICVPFYKTNTKTAEKSTTSSVIPRISLCQTKIIIAVSNADFILIDLIYQDGNQLPYVFF